jgi:hypothetical protein
MSARNGDKSRFGRQRKQRILKREKQRKLVESAQKPPAEPGKAA